MARLSIAGAMLALATLAVGHTTAAVSDKHDPCSIVPHTAARAAQQCFQSSRPAVQFQPDGNGKTARYPAAVSWQKSTSVPGQCPVGHGALCGSWQNPVVSALRPENC